MVVGPGLLTARWDMGIKNPVLLLQGLSGLSLALEQNPPQLMANLDYKVTYKSKRTNQSWLRLLFDNPHRFPNRHKA